MRPAYGWYAISNIEIQGSDHYIQCMIMNNRDLVLDALAALWNRRKRGQEKLNGNVLARAVYMRHFNNLSYVEIAQELHISKESAYVYVGKGMSFIRQYVSRKYKGDLVDPL
jgi:hypothetical protein